MRLSSYFVLFQALKFGNETSIWNETIGMESGNETIKIESGNETIGMDFGIETKPVICILCLQALSHSIDSH